MIPIWTPGQLEPWFNIENQTADQMAVTMDTRTEQQNQLAVTTDTWKYRQHQLTVTGDTRLWFGYGLGLQLHQKVAHRVLLASVSKP